MTNRVKEKEDAERKKKVEHDKALDFALSNYNNDLLKPKASEYEPKLVTRAYEEYMAEEKLNSEPSTWYEKACAFSGKFIHVTPDDDTKEKIINATNFSNLKVTPEGVMAFAILTGSIITVISIILSLIIPTAVIPILIKLFMIVLGPIMSLLIIIYPMNHSLSLRIQTSGNLVIAVLYIVVYMKSNPSLEGAIRFAAKNTTGKLSNDFKRMLWRLESGEIKDLDDGLMDYVASWKMYNREFMDSIEYIRASMHEMDETRRSLLLDRAVDNILRGTDEKMKMYARSLNMPIMILQGLGILLPVMGMIMFPLISIFMGDSIPNVTTYLFFGYNILLPSVLLFLLENILSRRPSTTTATDISHHPKALPVNKMHFMGLVVPVWPFAVATTLAILFMGYFLKISMAGIEPVNIFQSFFASSLLHSMFVIWGVAAGFIVYGYFRSAEKIDLIRIINLIEDQFEAALFALGNRLSGGAPLEISLIKAAEDTKDLEISGLFDISAKNMNRLSMTFKQSLFDVDYGALIFYPSKMIRTIMLAISESVKKGTKSAAMTMIIISEYLRALRTTQEKIEDLLSETVNNMRFQAYLLIPIISGVVVGVSQIIMRMLAVITEKMAVFSTGDLSLPTDAMFMFDLENATPPEVLQVIVGIYLIQLLVIISRFIDKIDNGGDQIKEADILWKVMITGVLVYTIVLFVITVMFGNIIDGALSVM
ncbi:MAG: type II secretion system F family protein [DPANN group archaeon]|nr:type II secretion system F family protein [DPANN group archaeon]